ncbi:MAG: proton-conducting transporter membrane subunit [Candidatus Limnocylindria bacterium]
MSEPLALSLVVAVPVAGALLTVLARRSSRVRDAVTLLASLCLFLLVASLAPAVASGARPAVTWLELMPGLALALEVEPLGFVFGSVASGLWIASSLYSIGYMRANDERDLTRYYASFALAIGSAVGLAFSANLLTLFVFYELLTFSTYPLVTHRGGREDRRAGRLYLGTLFGTSVSFLLLAILWTWVATGTTDFREGGILAGAVEGPLVAVLLALYVYGSGKAALMPLHRWLPAAMVAPTPVSALLHAVAVVKAGVFTIVKVITYTFGLDLLASISAAQWLMYVSGATVVLASLVALQQDDLKRRLAYSTISQLAYVVMAASIFTPAGIVGGALHIVSHAFGKVTLFFAAGSIHTASHKTRVSQLSGIGPRMPWTMAAFAVGSLSIIGLPPTGGFVSKWLIMSAAAEAERWFILGVVVVSTLLTAGYFVPILYRAYLRPAAGGAGDRAHGESPRSMVVALTATAVLAVALFLAADLPLSVVGRVPE